MIGGPCEARSRGVDFRHWMWEVAYASQCALRLDPSPLRMVPGKTVTRRNQRKNDRQARAADRRCREAKSAGAGPAGAFLRPLFLRRTADALVRADGARAQRSNDFAHAEAGEKAPN